MHASKFESDLGINLHYAHRAHTSALLDAFRDGLVGSMHTETVFLFIKRNLRRIMTLLPAALYLLACRVGIDSSAAASSNRAEIEFSHETARSAYDFVNSIGANTHLSYFDRQYGDFPFVEKELASIGIRHLRDGVHLQNSDYNSMLYGRFAQLGKMGIRFDAVVDPRSNLGPITPELLQRVYDLSGQTIECFEGPNELDISNMNGWSDLDRSYNETLFKAARAMPEGTRIKVISPSMAFASHGGAVGDLSKRIDFGNLHSYPAGKMPAILFPDQQIFAKEISGGNQVIVTETGYHNALNDHNDQPAVSEAAAAKYMPRLFLEDFAHGIPRSYLYEFLDEATDPGLKDNQLHWGLIRANGTEKPAFTALKNLISELSDTAEPARLQQLPWALSYTNAQTHHLLVQKSDGEFDLIFWQEIPSYDPKRQVDIANAADNTFLTLGRQARSVTVYEPALQAQALHTYTGVTQIPLAIPDHPLVVRILMP
jgi:hypothetical protein